MTFLFFCGPVALLSGNKGDLLSDLPSGRYACPGRVVTFPTFCGHVALHPGNKSDLMSDLRSGRYACPGRVVTLHSFCIPVALFFRGTCAGCRWIMVPGTTIIVFAPLSFITYDVNKSSIVMTLSNAHLYSLFFMP